ncbi:MAG: hypothetical protein J6Y02_19495 [Pseudobutyrivibrio sp.]|nr:hypothetical protein [Pseudobutyrivibrio sp.]
MYLYPYKIFAPSRKVWDPKANKGKGKMMKFLFNDGSYKDVVGIYQVNRCNLKEVQKIMEKYTDSYISVLLGEVRPGVYLGCLDLDHCKNYDNTDLEPETKELLKEFKEHEWEWSQSGDGIHIFYLTRKPYTTKIVKDISGCKSFEWYCDGRYILTTTFDFNNTDLEIGKHDEFLDKILKKMEEKKESERKISQEDMIKSVFDGKVITDVDQFQNSILAGRNPVETMDVLRKCCLKDDTLKDLIDAESSSVDQSQHDARLLKKLMYYTLSFEGAYILAKKTNYYKSKDKKHIKKFDDPRYIERTRQFIERN